MDDLTVALQLETVDAELATFGVELTHGGPEGGAYTVSLPRTLWVHLERPTRLELPLRRFRLEPPAFS